jgi:hypothetical protein
MSRKDFVEVFLLISLAFFYLVFLSACQEVDSNGHLNKTNLAHEVAPRFREFYALLGGDDVLGIPISPKFNQEGVEYQYTAAALMKFDPLATRSKQFQLAPIGIVLGIAEIPTHPEVDGGHSIYPSFKDFYDAMGGVEVVGLPLTSVRYNTEKGCIEQYFENLGFYLDELDKDGSVHLLHYGAWLCATSCGYESPASSEIVLPSVVKTPFEEAISRLNPQFFGKPLGEPYIATDGNMEQIFENVVVISAPDKPGGITLRPITTMLEVPIQKDGNFEIPPHFLEYLNQNSGLEFSGPAVTEYKIQSNELHRQCFTNLCLDYYPSKPIALQVRPASLGYIYKSRFYQESDEELPVQVEQEITLKVWEGYSVIPPNAFQRIGVAVYQGRQPLPGVEPVLILMLPTGSMSTYTFSPTRADGKSFLDIKPVSASHGTSIGYRVCAEISSRREEICIEDDYLVWGNP